MQKGQVRTRTYFQVHQPCNNILHIFPNLWRIQTNISRTLQQNLSFFFHWRQVKTSNDFLYILWHLLDHSQEHRNLNVFFVVTDQTYNPYIYLQLN